MKTLTLAMAAFALAIPSSAQAQCQSEQNETHATRASLNHGKPDIVDTAVAAGSFKTLVTAVKAAGLVDALKGEGPFTVFAPSDEAFAKLDKATLSSLLEPENRALLQSILTYHVVPGRVAASQVVKLTGADTLNGQRAAIKVSENGVQIDGARVVATDIECGNGIIHVIDSVILPSTKNLVETAVGAGSFNTLAAAVKAAGLAEALSTGGPFTVFAPTDEAFAALPEGTVEKLLKPENIDQLQAILKYHVVEGRVFAAQATKLDKAGTLQGSMVKFGFTKEGSFQVNGANIVATDVQATNGVIHVIDRVLLP